MINWTLFRFHFVLLLVSSLLTVAAHTQNLASPLINLGDPAPPLQVRSWLKGAPIQKFEESHVYVVEFWATWCKPCIAAMPHLSDLARQFKGQVTIIGMDVMEKKTTSIQKVKAFVDSMGNRMDYHVAVEDSNFTEADWLGATGEQSSGIPRSFVVNGEGKLAWIGHPMELEKVIPKIVNHTWDVNAALAERKEERRLEEPGIWRKYAAQPFAAWRTCAGV